MTYQGERARPVTVEDVSEFGRCFEVSKVRIGADGHVSEVLWTRVNAASDQAAYGPVTAPTAEVVNAIHDGAQVAAVFAASGAKLPARPFVIFQHEDGRECIVLEEPPSPGRNLDDMAGIDD